MTEVAHSRVIAAPTTVVWAVLADFPSLAEWAPAITHSSSMSDATEGIGMVRRVAVGATILLERVSEWEPEASLAYEVEGLPPVVASVVNQWTLSPEGAGTAVTLTATVEPGPKPPMKVVAALAARKIGSTNKMLLDCLAAEAEKRGAAS